MSSNFPMSSNLNDAIEGIMDRGFRLGANGLDSTERTIYVISNADFEICLGSVSGYLYNSAGDDIDLLPVAFEEIGCLLLATRARKLVSAMLAYGCVPSDRQSRGNLIQSDNATINQLFDELTCAVQDREEDFGQMLVDYFDYRRAA